MTDKLREIFRSVQQQLLTSLLTARAVHDHPTTKGDACESNWITALERHLPHRYGLTRASVVDADGNVSDAIDLVIYDRQYTPCLFDYADQRILTAESVYGVFEVKQTLNAEHVQYAAAKAASVRKLRRTSAPVVHAGGQFAPRPPAPILAGILTLRSDWNPPFGPALQSALTEGGGIAALDLGCSVEHGAFEASYQEDGQVALEVEGSEFALAAFLFRLLRRLQNIGTVTATDYSEYLRTARKGARSDGGDSVT